MSTRTWIVVLLAIPAAAVLIGSLAWSALGGATLGDGETLLLPALVVTVVGLFSGQHRGAQRALARVRTRRRPPR